MRVRNVKESAAHDYTLRELKLSKVGQVSILLYFRLRQLFVVRSHQRRAGTHICMRSSTRSLLGPAAAHWVPSGSPALPRHCGHIADETHSLCPHRASGHSRRKSKGPAKVSDCVVCSGVLVSGRVLEME